MTVQTARIRRNGFAGVWGILLAVLITACGGGGTGESGGPAPAGGEVVLFVSNSGSPSPPAAALEASRRSSAGSDVERILVTVSAVDLVGGDHTARVFAGRKQLDLMALGAGETPFAFSQNATPGTYDRIRWTVDKVELFAPGTTLPIDVTVPGNGRIDLPAREPFSVHSGETLTVELDFDSVRCVRLRQAGGGGHLFRPIAFVKVYGGRTWQGLARVSGMVLEVDAVDSSFVLCRHTADGAPHSAPGDCLNVLTSGDTSIFGPDGTPVSFSQIEPGKQVTAAGQLTGTLAVDGAAGPLTELDASAVFPGSFARVHGSIEGTPDLGRKTLLLRLDPVGGAARGRADVELLEGARIVSADGAALALGDLGAGQRVAAEGLVSVAEPRVRAALVAVSPLARIEGVVVGLDAGRRRVNVETPGGAGVCVALAPDAAIRRVVASGQEFSEAAVDVGALTAGDLFVALVTGGSECLTAEVALVGR